MTNSTYPFELPPLPYAPEALEPHVDARTMRIHHDEHHRVYVERLNAALKDHPQLHGQTIEDLLRGLDRVPEGIRTAVRNNGGGHLNHSLLWSLMAPPGQAGPTGKLLEALKASFGSVEAFRKRFSEVATGHFASGWAFLVADSKKQTLEVLSLPDHQCVLDTARDGASRLRRLGTRVLPEAPESAGRVPGLLVGGCELAGGGTSVRPLWQSRGLTFTYSCLHGRGMK